MSEDKRLSPEERRARLRSLFAAANTGHHIGCTCAKCKSELKKQQDNARKPARFQNPLLLTAKLFLSEIRAWRENYQYPHYVCTHFAKVLFDAATVRGIRCGYVTVQFDSKPAHAIVAFETDYGLTFFEPQTGDQEYVTRGRPYSSHLEGVPLDCPVDCIDIEWNDQMNLRFVSCKGCGYLWPISYDEPCPTSCPIDGCERIAFTERGVL
jgi:hypothetical protein